MIRRSFQNISKWAFIPLYKALVRPYLEYAKSACLADVVADINPLERIQRLTTRLETDIRRLPYEEWQQRLGLHSLRRRRRRLWTDLIAAFKIFMGLLDIDPNFFFLPPARCGLSGTPTKLSNVRGWHFRWGLWNTGIMQCFQGTVGDTLDRNFSSSSHCLNTYLPISLPPSHPTRTLPIDSYHLYMLPNSMFYWSAI